MYQLGRKLGINHLSLSIMYDNIFYMLTNYHSLQSEHKPTNRHLERNHANPQSSLDGVDRGSASEDGASRCRRTSHGGVAGGFTTAASETKTFCHVEEDVDVSVDATEQFLAGSHGEDWDVGEGVDTLSFVSICMLANGSLKGTDKRTLEGFHSPRIHPGYLWG